jgi:hypothetical protein
MYWVLFRVDVSSSYKCNVCSYISMDTEIRVPIKVLYIRMYTEMRVPIKFFHIRIYTEMRVPIKVEFLLRFCTSVCYRNESSYWGFYIRMCTELTVLINVLHACQSKKGLVDQISRYSSINPTTFYINWNKATFNGQNFFFPERYYSCILSKPTSRCSIKYIVIYITGLKTTTTSKIFLL